MTELEPIRGRTRPWVAGGLIATCFAALTMVAFLWPTSASDTISPDLHAPRTSEEREATLVVAQLLSALAGADAPAACRVLGGPARQVFGCTRSAPRIPARYRRPRLRHGRRVDVLDGVSDGRVTTGVAVRSRFGPALVSALRRRSPGRWQIIRVGYGAFL